MGERAEILLRLDDGKVIPAILRTDGPQFHEFSSSSRGSLLQLEKRYMGESRRAGLDKRQNRKGKVLGAKLPVDSRLIRTDYPPY